MSIIEYFLLSIVTAVLLSWALDKIKKATKGGSYEKDTDR